MVNWNLRLKVYGKYRLGILQRHIDGKVLNNKQLASSSSNANGVSEALSETKLILSKDVPILVEHTIAQSDINAFK
jgi:hypothetical protein